MTVLCPSKRFYEQQGRRHQTLLERAWQIIRIVRRWLPGRELVFVADSSFAALEWLALVARLPRVSVITRLRLDAALYDPPPPRAPGQRGRPRLKGKRRPTLEAVLADEKTQWSTLTVDDWYGEGPREVDVATDTAVWYHTGKPPVALRWVLIRDPQERFNPRSRGLNEHGGFSCAKCCLPAHKQGWGNPWEAEVGKKCPRWVVTRDAAWRCKPDNGNIAVFKRTLLSILHANRGKIA